MHKLDPSSWTDWLAGATALTGIAALALPSLPAADTWWQLAAGRLIVTTGGVPSTDPFSFVPGRGPWLNHEWLAEVLFYLVFQVSGLDGLFLARTALVVVAFAVLPLWGACRRGVAPGVSAAVVLGCGLAAEGWAFFDARPYVFTYLGLSITFVLVREYLATGRSPVLAALPPITALWANCHGGFVLGPVASGLAALGCLLPAMTATNPGMPALAPRRPHQAAVLAGITCASLLLAGVATPYGLESLAFPFSLLGRSAFTVGLNEWAAPSFGTLEQPGSSWPFLALALAAAGLMLAAWRRTAWPERFWVLAFLGAGLTTWRHIPLAALALAHVLPDCLPVPTRRPLRWLLAVGWTGALVLALGALVPRAQEGASKWTMEKTHFPSGAVAFLEANPVLPHRLFNPYEWGGYLAWTAFPPYRTFIDGRANTLYTEGHYARALWVQYGDSWKRVLEREGLGGLVDDPAGWEGVLAQEGVDLVLCSRLLGDLAARLESSGRWFVIYRDPMSAVYLRESPAMRALATRLRPVETAGTLLEKGLRLVQEGREQEAAEALRGALGLDPEMAQARSTLGILLLRVGRTEEGAHHLHRALEIEPRTPDANFNLALLALQQGDPQAARRYLRAEIRWNPDHPRARTLLEQIGP